MPAEGIDLRYIFVKLASWAKRSSIAQGALFVAPSLIVMAVSLTLFTVLTRFDAAGAGMFFITVMAATS